ncbi:hypothetical protein Are01nite_72700 [Actinoplanes regularis]|nr:hypothetical protein Are01nite_72700 [Actinoplanes regularis]
MRDTRARSATSSSVGGRAGSGDDIRAPSARTDHQASVSFGRFEARFGAEPGSPPRPRNGQYLVYLAQS